MADRQVTQQNIIGLLGKLDDPDADLRYMSLNDLYGILSNPQSTFISSDHRSAQGLAEGLLKALDDQHGDVQNQALKWFAPRVYPPRLYRQLTSNSITVLARWLSDCHLKYSQSSSRN